MDGNPISHYIFISHIIFFERFSWRPYNSNGFRMLHYCGDSILIFCTNSFCRTGSYLEIEYTVLEGEYQGRKVWDRLCLNHPTQKTVDIARANLSAICHAIDILRPRESNELHHIPLVITVKAKKDESTETIFNEVKGYAKRESRIAPSQQATQYPQSNEDTPPYWRGSSNN